MAGVGLRSEKQFDHDSTERAKRDLGKDLGDMGVDGGADRPAKDKPIEITPQIAKKTKKDEAAERGVGPPPNIHISTPKGRQEVPSSSSKTQSVPRPRRGRSEESRRKRRESPPISASVAVEATEAAKSAAPNGMVYEATESTCEPRSNSCDDGHASEMPTGTARQSGKDRAEAR